MLIFIMCAVSDTCSSGEAEDKSGANLRKLIENGFM